MADLTATTSRTEHDAVVVVGRVAGAATALLLARAGCDVVVLERSCYGTDTVSTHALLRPGVLQLARWGVLDAIVTAGTPAIRRNRFHFGGSTVDLPVKDADGVPALYAPRRTLLDAVLVDAARAAGARFHHGVSVRDVRREQGRVVGVSGHDADGHPFEARGRITIGADGARSTIARLVGAPVTRTGTAAAAVVYGYFDLSADEADDAYDWHYGPAVTAGAIPTNGSTLVFVAASPERVRRETAADVDRGFRRLLAAAAPTLAARLGDRAPVERYRRFPGRPGHVRQPFGDGWALVGDAGYHRDALAAQGLGDALRDAELLADAFVCGDGTADSLAGYEQTRDQATAEAFAITERIAALDWTLDEIPTLLAALDRATATHANLGSSRR